MSVEIDPQELGFHRPFTAEVSETLKIRNPNPHPVAFKVKTTAPKQPNSGRVEPGKEVEVSVILQAMKQEPPPDTKCRDKFLVQSVPITGDKEFANLAAIWDGIEKSAVQERKIRVVFLPPKGTVGAPSLETPSKPSAADAHAATPDVAPPAYSSPSAYVAAGESKDRDEASPGPAGLAASAMTKHADLSYDELKQQLAQAEKLIGQLKQDQGGLRQRKTGAADDKSGASSKPADLAQQVRAGTEGVPVQITAVLCLLSFLLAYLFF
ncbi:putative msp domain-containing protein [Eutypa lata UCREL1]|uniref:Putative msp domain-containing protein n=1 Tax=Eutypa lata (strain UCR-EL1) TaxID=1287681 RepID=M7SRZ9_EUTLA|nr:putative msp domain-containing protein [Eutypa lata UCREL1]